MKNLRTIPLCVCMSLISLFAAAQSNSDVPALNETNYNKPKLFQAFPEQIVMNATAINNLLNGTVGSTVDLNIGEGTSFRFSGNIVSAATKNNDKLVSVVVKSSNFGGAVFTVSKVMDDLGAITYKGRIMSRTHGDVYELQHLNGKFVFVKRNYYEIVTE